MTEAEWLDSHNIWALVQQVRGQASGRKLRLFACACCRRVWHLLTDERYRVAVEVAERYADGLARKAELTSAREGARAAANAEFVQHLSAGSVHAPVMGLMHPAALAATAGSKVCHDFWLSATYAGYLLGLTAGQGWGQEFARLQVAEQQAQAALLRDIIGNPFHPPRWSALWRTPATLDIARGIYEERAFDRLPILADALEEAGCVEKSALEHCRTPGPHARGCWVVDRVLGRS